MPSAASSASRCSARKSSSTRRGTSWSATTGNSTLAPDFYDDFAADYHLAYGGKWDAAVERQGRALAELLPAGGRVLDCSCGIGTQAIGLALLGCRVVGTDPSQGAIERARR